MGKKKKTTKTPLEENAPAGAPFHAGLAGLAALRDELPAGDPLPPDEDAAPSTEDSAPAATARFAGRLIARTERKGRGGKTVTLLLGLRADEAQRRELAKELARGLGCAARVEGDQLVLGGDLRDRLVQWLGERGADVRAV